MCARGADISAMPRTDSKTGWFIDVLAGTFGGVAQVVVGHPLDTIKTKLQLQVHTACASRNCGEPLFAGGVHAFRSLLAAEGLRGL